MAGPTTSVVDNFNRTENPLATASSGATWAQFSGAGGIGLGTFQANGTVCLGNSANSQMYITGADGANCEAYTTISTVPGTSGSVDIAIRLVDTASVFNIDGYAGRLTKQSGGADDTLEIYRITNLAATLLASVTQELTNGQGFLIRANGSTLEIDYYNGSTWSNVLSTTDSTYSGGGVKGLTLASSAVRIDDFGGGTLAGGTTYTQSLSGSITPTGALTRQTNKTLAGGVTPTGAINKRTSKSFTGSLTPTGALIAIKIALISLVGSITPTGALTRQTNKTAAGGITPTGTIAKRISKILAGGITPSGALTTVKVALISLAGSITPTGAITKRTGKALSGGVVPTGTLIKSTAKAFAGSVTPTGAISRLVGKALAGTVTPSASLIRRTAKALTGALTPTAILAKRAAKSFTGALAPSAVLTAIANAADALTPALSTIADAAYYGSVIHNIMYWTSVISDQPYWGSQTSDRPYWHAQIHDNPYWDSD